MSATPEPAVRGALSDAKRALLEQRLRGRGPADDGAEISRRPAVAAAALSPGQQRLWFLHQLAPASDAYTMFDARRLHGWIDAGGLRESLARVVLRHEVLRTRYETRDGQPFAVVAPHAAFDFETRAFDALPADEREALAREHATQFIRRPFDLETGPVLRAALLRLGSEEHLLVLAVHHIACDEWSLGILWRELASTYVAGQSGQPLPAEAASLQYADCTHWQRTRRASPAVDGHLAYWRQVLRDCPPSFELPADRAAPARRSFRGGVVSARLEPDAARSLAAIARGAGTTDFVLHLAAFFVLLHRYTAESDLVVGTPVTGRSHPALESVVGFFLNTLPIRTDLSGDPPFRELLRRVHDAFIDAVTHRDTPFEAMVDAVAPERRLSRNPLFSVMFVEQGEAAAVSFGDGVTASAYPLEAGGSKFDLTLFAGDSGDHLDLMIEYDADRFDRSSALRMVAQFRTLLAAIAAEPDLAVSRLPLASREERQRLDAWGVGPPVGAVEPVHTRFHALARTAPHRTAVLTNSESLTYEQLRVRAQELAGRLRGRGIGPGEFVGLCVDRSPDMIAGILGILEAGAAYVPLDPTYPPHRLDFTIRDTGARLVLATREHAARIPAAGPAVLPLEGEADVSFPRSSKSPSGNRGSLADAAYVLHTSGSTGVPKGVVVTHGNLACSTAARSIAYPQPPDVFLLLPSFAFDSSVAGIFWTLTTGGTLALPPRRIEQDVHALAAFIERHAVTHTLCLPSLWETILEHAPAALLRSLRTVIVAGEACSTRLVRRHYETLPEVSLWNEYGPTEATVWSTAYAIPRGFDGARVPIGSPIAGTRVHVLEPVGEPAPIGVPGELWIGGAGVVAGYLNRPADFAARFVSDPFVGASEARLYRTGDRARWRDDGVLEFMGRADQQIKVRGYRIEPAEIESVLREHVAVADVVVAARAVGQPASASATGIERLVEALGAMDPGEAERILAFVENLSAEAP